jgi:hypothetical protein
VCISLWIQIVALVGGVMGLVSTAVRAIESINELSKTPDLNTWAKCVQVVKNFFTVEKYKAV